jgi:hypothetical protein
MSADDPTRWLDSAEAPLSLHERAALETLARRGPSSLTRARMLAALPPAVIFGSHVEPRVSTDAPTSAERGRPQGGTARLGGRLPWLFAGAGVLVAVVAAWLSSSWRYEDQAAAEPTRVAPVAALSLALPQGGGDRKGEGQEREEVQERALGATGGEKRVLGAQQARAGAHAKQQGPVGGRAPVHALAPDPVAELALLSPARAVLAIDPARALALSDEHERRFPGGVFKEERAFLRIEALVRLGRRNLAEEAARRFRRAYPQSSYGERLTQVLGSSP